MNIVFRTLVGMLELAVAHLGHSWWCNVSNPCRYAGTYGALGLENRFPQFRTLVGMLEHFCASALHRSV